MKIEATGNDDSSHFNRLPYEIVFEILNKLIDLKTLCISEVVSKRFYSIIHQIDTISFPARFGFSSENPQYFFSAIDSVKTFKCVKCLYIVLPSSSANREGIEVDADCLLKWKINFGNRIATFVFLPPNSVCQENDHEEEEEEEEDDDVVYSTKKCAIACICKGDASMRYWVLIDCVMNLPLLEKVSIKDSCKRGTVSVSGRKLADLRNLLPEQRMSFSNFPPRSCHCYIPLLKLPVSGYVMKGVTMFLFEGDDISDDGDYSFINSDLDDDKFEDKEGTAYTEAMTEILKKHRGQIKRFG